MMTDTQIEASVSRILKAAAAVGKSRLAAMAGIRESNLRRLGRSDWNPTRETLRKLEAASVEVLSESERAA